MWARFFSMAFGVWLMAAPAVLSYSGAAAKNSHIVGPMIVTAAIIALSQVLKMIQWLNVIFGLWLLLAPWVLSGFTDVATINSLIVGAVLIPLAMVPQASDKRVGGGWKALWKNEPQEAQ